MRFLESLRAAEHHQCLPPGLTRLELFEKLTGHVKGSTGIIGLFKNPL
jgi:hypothetical protein